MAEKTNTPEAASASAPKTNGMSKMEAVKKALAALGKEAKPTVIQGYVKSKFNIEMSTDHISTYKGEIARKAKGGAKPAAPVKKAAAPKVAALPKKPAAKP